MPKYTSEVELISRAINELSISRKSIELYPPEHPIIKESVERATELLKNVLKKRGEITIGIAKDTLVVDDFTLDKKNPSFQEFAINFYCKGIVAITIYSKINVNDLFVFLNLINMRDAPIGEGLVELAKQHDLRQIKLTPLDLSVIDFKEELKPESPERKIIDDYIYGLIEGRLTEKVAEDLVNKVPPEHIASYVNGHMSGNSSGEQCDKIIAAYIGIKTKHIVDKQKFMRFIVFLENLKPELKVLFLNRALSHHFSENELEKILSKLDEFEIRRIYEIFEKSYVTIPLSLKNLIEKFLTVEEKGDFYFDLTPKGNPYIDDIEIDRGIMKLLQEDHFDTFVSKEYQKELEMMIKGVEIVESTLTEELMRESGERVVDKSLADIILEILESETIESGDCLKLITRLSGLVDAFIETGRFKELCDVYNTIFTYSLSGRFKVEASGMLEYFFRSEKFIQKLIEAFKIWGKYDQDNAIKLAKVLRLYLVSPLLDAFTEETNQNIRKFFISLLSNMGINVANEAAKRLNDKRVDNLINMIGLIRECGGKQYTAQIKLFVKNKDENIRKEAIKTLICFGDKEGIAYLKTYLNSKDPKVKEEAILLSGTNKIKETVPFLIKILDKKDILGTETYYKLLTIRALAQIGDPQAIEPLIRLYKSPFPFFSSSRDELRLEIFKNLRNYPATSIKPLLEMGLNSSNYEIRSISSKLLKEIEIKGDKRT
jgi:hypothetical protein